MTDKLKIGDIIEVNQRKYEVCPATDTEVLCDVCEGCAAQNDTELCEMFPQCTDPMDLDTISVDTSIGVVFKEVK